ncbi:hypothetical protein [Humibacillus xanthopallidus]|uniref:Gp5/Type VI secretion system Vgr protein OB-fold domain-containing protein n=1 Tax=Humibacillus xanthopallidus TaxID=412689 RepID=A0A543HUD7_9MICO|nr:hypothetical protein [Humibacillus xanthopallidus]TQM61945.1 hypothetical protein FBY41_1967 [Humibacillus xanthopallidus]
MSSMVEAIRAVVRRELAGLRGPALGVITGLHPHSSDSDDFNDEVDVTLQHEKAQLVNVPVAVDAPGTSAPLKTGDVVLVQFLGGDLQQPLVTACFHTADDRPPLHKEHDRIVEQRVDGKPRNRMKLAADGQLTFQRFDANGDQAVTLLLDGDGKLTITAKDKEVTITCSTLTVEGNLTVKKGNVEVTEGTMKATNSANKSTTIDGNKIIGA